ncbi:MAG: phage tail domain-containing protein [Candidatus Dehalobacter alkaniphilus]
MREIKFVNERSQTLIMGDDSDYALTSITGISPSSANIQTSSIANFDGTTFISSVMNQRNIVIGLQLRGNVEENRLRLYDIFKIKRKGTFYYHSDLIEAQIEGYVEMVDVSPTNWPVIAMISLICPKPYFEALDSIIADVTSIDGELLFPLELLSSGIKLGSMQTLQEVNVINPGDISIGMIIRFRGVGAVVKPKLQNTQTLEFIELDTSMIAGDIITINTEIGQKRIELNRGGVITNIFNTLVIGSKFIQLNEGDNVLYGSAQSGSVSLLIEVEYRAKYSGV